MGVLLAADIRDAHGVLCWVVFLNFLSLLFTSS
ncbi:MAG: hypothetical protein ACI9FW_001936 [Flavobacterium sp.]